MNTDSRNRTVVIIAALIIIAAAALLLAVTMNQALAGVNPLEEEAANVPDSVVADFVYDFHNDYAAAETPNNNGDDPTGYAPEEVQADPTTNASWFDADYRQRLYDQDCVSGDSTLLAQAAFNIERLTGQHGLILPLDESPESADVSTIEAAQVVTVMRLVGDEKQHVALANRYFEILDTAESVEVEAIGDYTSMAFQKPNNIQLPDELAEKLGRDTIPSSIFLDSGLYGGYELIYRNVDVDGDGKGDVDIHIRINCGYQPICDFWVTPPDVPSTPDEPDEPLEPKDNTQGSAHQNSEGTKDEAGPNQPDSGSGSQEETATTPLPEPCSHTYGGWTITKQPQVGVPGWKVHTCTKCEFSEGIEVAALVAETHTHVWAKKTVTAAQVGVAGKGAVYCTGCGHINSYFTVDALPSPEPNAPTPENPGTGIAPD